MLAGSGIALSPLTHGVPKILIASRLPWRICACSHALHPPPHDLWRACLPPPDQMAPQLP